MARYRIDPARSQVSVVRRPRLGDGPGATVASVVGEVDTDGAVVRDGTLTVTLDSETGARAAIDLVGSHVEPGPEGDDTVVLTGRADRPASAFGLAGPPLLNPTLQLRWRLVLVPS